MTSYINNLFKLCHYLPSNLYTKLNLIIKLNLLFNFEPEPNKNSYRFKFRLKKNNRYSYMLDSNA